MNYRWGSGISRSSQNDMICKRDMSPLPKDDIRSSSTTILLCRKFLRQSNSLIEHSDTYIYQQHPSGFGGHA